MKNNTRLTSVFTALMLTTLPTAATFAQAPGGSPPPPPPPHQGAQPPQPPEPPQPPRPPHERHHEPMPFLGVLAVPAPRVLTEQLNMPPGYGLIVESVVPDSPAAAAGIQRYDLLQMFNDQKLVAIDQLAALVHGTPDNTSVNITLLRKGQPQTVSAKLVRRSPGEEERGPRRGGPGREDRAEEGPGRDWMHFRPHDFFGGFGDDERGPGRRQIIIRHGDRGSSTTVDGNNAKMIIRDDTGEVEVAYKDGKRQVTVRRPNGEVVFSGPVDSEEDRKKLPPDALAKLDRLSHEHRDGASRPQRHNDSARNEDEDSDFIFEDGSSRPGDSPSS